MVDIRLTTPPSQDEIIRVHDILDTILNDLKPIMPAATEFSMRITLECLCWILGHKKGENFMDNITMLEGDLACQGIVFPTIEEINEKMNEKMNE